MRALPDDRRRALTLRFVEEMSTAEIAGVLGRSEGAVRVLIHRALGAVARTSAATARAQVPRGDPRMTDEHEVDALVADRYLDALLAAVDRHAADAPSDATLDPDVREAARVLRASLVRVHPSFRFEERLAGRLADLAASQARPALAAAGGGTLIELPGRLARRSSTPTRCVDAILRGELDPTDADAVDRAADASPAPARGRCSWAARSRRPRSRSSASRTSRGGPRDPQPAAQQPGDGTGRARRPGAPRRAATAIVTAHRHASPRLGGPA